MSALQATARLVRPLRSRDPHEPHRVSSPLELLTDLCFVVAVSQAAQGLHHGLTGGHLGHAVVGYAMAFFAIWWAWVNFTWFGSAYDNDDVAYRLLTILQIAGVLVLAAGLPGLVEGHYAVTVLGYVIMRVALVLQWLRAAEGDPVHRQTCLRYAVGIVVVQLGWVAFVWVAAVPELRVPVFVLLALADAAVPFVAERTTTETPWHPEHIADRYGAFFIIVLGETILSLHDAFSEAFAAGGPALRHLVVLAGCGVVTIFSLWWLYFSRPAAPLLEGAARDHTNLQFAWGFGHYVIFGSAAALGAGLAARVDYWGEPEQISGAVTGWSLAVPLAALLVSVWFIHLRHHDRTLRTAWPVAVAVLLVLAGAWTPYPEVVGAAAVVALLATETNLARVSPDPRTEPAAPATP